ncbi:hypothetical protein BFW01_g695 [Lasiodiplodia theobromae]|uniref:uncharacterized protein n=1 Tax=Lasiodiplodia theobromae TaxID=45133 RepID=UPI0015C323B1|nr:uncharacterized protein LTHEOB_6293 [Lasiodiplodia theobromae]KAF4544175.1 hypothetical protein LTHEOB_6293 [Lasiodiplodia theobromae]KAF9641335.1 hypothetical protein BFW01_g695 [Lasiodiplodia theobromae]
MEHRITCALAADLPYNHHHHQNDAAARKPNLLAPFAPSSSPFSSPSSPAPPQQQQPDDHPAPLIKRIQHDLAEALRLHSSPPVQQRLSLLAAQRAWVEEVVRDALEALAAVGGEVGGSDEGEVVRRSREEAVRSDGWRRQWGMMALRQTATATTTTREKEGEGEGVRGERVAALAACHASLLSAVAKMQRMEEEGVVVGVGEAGTAGKMAGLVVGGGCDNSIAGLPTYESSRNDERVVPWEYRPEGDAMLRPSSTRKRFIKSRKDEKPRNVEEDLRGGSNQHTRAVTLDEAFPYLQAFFKAIPEDAKVDTPTELPVELPAEVPLDRIPTAPKVHAATSSPGLLSPHPAFYTQSFDSSRDPQWDRASFKIPCDPAEITSNGSRLSASAMSKRRSFRKAKLGETSQGVWETPDSIPNNIGWAP